jgi:hypothetical protein
MYAVWFVPYQPRRRRGHVRPRVEIDIPMNGPENIYYLISTDPNDNEPLTVLLDWMMQIQKRKHSS